MSILYRDDVREWLYIPEINRHLTYSCTSEAYNSALQFSVEIRDRYGAAQEGSFFIDYNADYFLTDIKQALIGLRTTTSEDIHRELSKILKRAFLEYILNPKDIIYDDVIMRIIERKKKSINNIDLTSGGKTSITKNIDSGLAEIEDKIGGYVTFFLPVLCGYGIIKDWLEIKNDIERIELLNDIA